MHTILGWDGTGQARPSHLITPCCCRHSAVYIQHWIRRSLMLLHHVSWKPHTDGTQTVSYESATDSTSITDRTCTSRINQKCFTVTGRADQRRHAEQSQHKIGCMHMATTATHDGASHSPPGASSHCTGGAAQHPAGTRIFHSKAPGSTDSRLRRAAKQACSHRNYCTCMARVMVRRASGSPSPLGAQRGGTKRSYPYAWGAAEGQWG